MSDYLRARIDALESHVTKLEQRIAYLEAKQEVSTDTNKYYQTDKINANYETR